jgi:hypothetical protein
MSDLNPDTAALIRAGRTAFRPKGSDRERVLQSLTQALGPGALLEGARQAGLAKSAAAARFPVRAWVLGGVGAIAVGAAVLVAVHPWSKASSSQSTLPVASSIAAAEPAPSAVIPPSPNEDDPAAEQQQPRAENPPSAPRPASRASAARSPDSLKEEVRLLSRAEQQLNSGHADEALRTLGEHERRFPSGALAEERMAARVQSLCALGRVAEARSDLTKLARTYPRSAHVDRARRFCGFDVNAAP